MNPSSKIRFVVLFVLCGLVSLPALAGEKKFGKDVTIEKATAIKQILEDPHKFENKDVRVEGIVTGLCKASGCWFKVKAKGGEEIFVKDPDHELAIPKDSIGKYVVAQGTVLLVPKKGHEEHAHQHDHAEGEEEHACPNPDVQIKVAGFYLKPVHLAPHDL